MMSSAPHPLLMEGHVHMKYLNHIIIVYYNSTAGCWLL